MGTSTSVLAEVVANEITALYDEVEATLNRISIQHEADIATHLETAKKALWEARMIADEKAGR